MVFYSCSSLTEIPEDLFKYNTKVTTFSTTFYNCSQLPCSSIASAAENWPSWNADGVTMNYAVQRTKKTSGTTSSANGYCDP
jgi:hypothetical protein